MIPQVYSLKRTRLQVPPRFALASRPSPSGAARDESCPRACPLASRPTTTTAARASACMAARRAATAARAARSEAANLAQSDCRSLSRSARAGPAASTHIWPRGAARPSGATPPAHATRRSLSAPTMRCASLWRPSGFAKSRPHNSCHLPFAGEAAAIGEPRDAAAAARSPLLHRANPPDCPHSFPARERRSPLACQSLRGSSPSAEDTRECAGRRDANAEACCP